MSLLYFFVAGALAGMMSSLLGIGGGIVIVPTLSFIFSFSHKEAIATSLLTITFIAAANVLRFQKARLINWNIVFLVAVFSSLSSMLAAYLATLIHERWLILFFVGFLFYLSWRTFRVHQSRLVPAFSKKNYFTGSKIGMISGFISGFAGVGGGAITTPMLLTHKLSDNRHVVPNSNGIMMFTAAFGALLFAVAGPGNNTGLLQAGFVHLDAAMVIFLGALPVALTGAAYQHRIPLRWRKTILGTFLVVIGFRLLLELISA